MWQAGPLPANHAAAQIADVCEPLPLQQFAGRAAASTGAANADDWRVYWQLPQAVAQAAQGH